jgi:uncharacterized protein YbjT (DUF2867 family)
VEVVKGDVLDVNSLHKALAGIDIAYYLVHSMGSSGSFERNEEISARNFGEAALKAGAKRIIYLGGLAEECDDQSARMRSRHLTGKVLLTSDVPTIERRASIVIGPGSPSFEMLRALAQATRNDDPLMGEGGCTTDCSLGPAGVSNDVYGG